MSKLTQILLAAAFFNGLAWIILIPIWQYPDEQSHFAQVQDIAEIGSVPKIGPTTSLEITNSEKFLGTERDGLGNNKFTYNPYYQIDYTDTNVGIFEKFIANMPPEARTSMVKNEATQNPPLYHIMSSNFYRLFGKGNLFDRVYGVRIFSLLLYLSIVAICLNAAKMIFPKIISQQTLAASIAFTPMLVFSTTGVLPDPLTIFLFSAIFTVCLKIIKTGVTTPLITIVAILNALGIYTRQQFQIAIPISLAACLYALYWKVPKQKKRFYWLGLALLILIFLISVKIAARIYPAILAIPELGIPDVSLMFTGNFTNYLYSAIWHYYSQTLPWYWGVYKWLSLTLPHTYYQIINRIIFVSGVGLAIWLFKIIKNQKIKKSDIPIFFFLMAILLYVSIFIVWDFYFQNTYGYPFGVQGRYFLPLILPITSVLLFGLTNLFELFLKKYLQLLQILVTFALILFNDVSLSYVSSSYYRVTNIKTFINQVSQYKPVILKGEVFILVLLAALLTQLIFLIYLFKFLKIKND